MILSVHDPIRGGFNYFEVESTVAINDDQPTPRYPGQLMTKLGVPASMAGRPLPPGAQMVGHGDTPKGSISSGLPGQWLGAKKADIPSGLGEYETVPGSNRLELALVGALAAGTCFAMVYQRPMKIERLVLQGAVAATLLAILHESMRVREASA